LYGCETWALILKEDYTLSTFGNRVLERYVDVTGEWGKLNNEELHNAYSSPNISRVNEYRRIEGTVHVGSKKR